MKNVIQHFIYTIFIDKNKKLEEKTICRGSLSQKSGSGKGDVGGGSGLLEIAMAVAIATGGSNLREFKSGGRREWEE